MVKCRGSYTVEATFIVTISLFVIMSVCYAAMFVHDKAAVLSCGRYQAEYHLQDGKVPGKELLESDIQRSLQGKLFIIHIQSVTVKKQVLQYKITINYTLSLSVPVLKQILLGSRESKAFILEHGYFRPSLAMWDVAAGKD